MKNDRSLVFCLFVCCLLTVSCSRKEESYSFTAMNTFMTVKTYGSNTKVLKRTNQQVQKEIERLEKILSTTIEESDVYKLNSCNSEETESFSLEPETIFLIEESQKFFAMTAGAFNPALYPVIREWGFTTGNYKIPEDGRIQELLEFTDFSRVMVEDNKIIRPAGLQLDFGAIGKGYAGDTAIEILQNTGIKSALLDFGGNVQVLGCKPDGSDWTVGIKNPWGGEPVAAVKLKDASMITSGGYERFFTGEDGKNYIHIFDGTTGRPVNNNLESVTIICPKGISGDALSTSLFVMGEEKALEFWQAYHTLLNFDFVILTKDRRIIYTESLKNSISLLFDFASVQIVEPVL